MVQIDNFTEVISVLSNDGMVLFPTDTVWGIGCDAKSEAAIRRLYKLKQRPVSDKFILLADSIDMVRDYVVHVHPRIDTLIQYHQRPLSVIYEQAKNLPAILSHEDGSIAFRVVQDGYCKELIREFGRPIVSTTANLEEDNYPSSFGSVSSTIIKGVDHVVPALHLENSDAQPSVIVRLSAKEELLFIRE